MSLSFIFFIIIISIIFSPKHAQINLNKKQQSDSVTLSISENPLKGTESLSYGLGHEYKKKKKKKRILKKKKKKSSRNLLILLNIRTF